LISTLKEWERNYQTVGFPDEYYTVICDGTYLFAVGRNPKAGDILTCSGGARITCLDLLNSQQWILSADSTRPAITMTEYGNFIYVAGWDNNYSPAHFYLEKRNKSDGELVWSRINN
jgi:hypothetical protein